MSLLRPLGSQWREPELGRTIIVSTWKGVLRVQGWPRKRGLPKEPSQINRLTLFSWYQRLIKRLTAQETIYEQDTIRQYNKENRGQRGSAAIRFRDWETQRLYGRGVGIIIRPGLTIYPPAISRDASFILDWTTQTPGQILQRGSTQWTEITHGTPGQLLSAMGPGSENQWTTPA